MLTAVRRVLPNIEVSKQKAPAEDRGFTDTSLRTYFNALETDENVVFKFVPRASTVAMMATEIPAAIRPYSMAVAPR